MSVMKYRWIVGGWGGWSRNTHLATKILEKKLLSVGSGMTSRANYYACNQSHTTLLLHGSNADRATQSAVTRHRHVQCTKRYRPI